MLEYKFQKNDVVKPTHASGLVLFIKDEKQIDKEKIISWLNINYYVSSREANYKNLTPKIIVEKSIFGKEEIEDIKFFCYKGRVKFIQVDFDRHSKHTRKLYSPDWHDLHCSLARQQGQKNMTKPIKLGFMISLAEKLSHQYSFLRIDMYYDKKSKKIAIGELTNCHGSAHEKFLDKKSEIKINKIISS